MKTEQYETVIRLLKGMLSATGVEDRRSVMEEAERLRAGAVLAMDRERIGGEETTETEHYINELNNILYK